MFYYIKFAFGSFRIRIRIRTVYSDSDPSKRSDPFGFGFGSPTLACSQPNAKKVLEFLFKVKFRTGSHDF